MALLDHIIRCNTKDLTHFRPLMIDEKTFVGWVREDRLDILKSFPEVFAVSRAGVAFQPGLNTPDARSAALATVCQALVDQKHVLCLREELYACRQSWMGPTHFVMDRQATPFFGIKAYGVHINGWVRRDDQPYLWIGRRAMDRIIEPGKLDNMVAGGQPAHLGLMDNVIKEAGEEAGLDAALASQARPVSVLSYCMETESGLKPDTLFCYDLEVDDSFRPHNTDGEASGFELWPISHVLEVMRTTQDFKFNVPLVLIDFAVRHGVLSPDTDPDYEALAAGLHFPHP